MFGGIGAEWIFVALIVALLAGVVKGAVGFALPTILISALGAFLPAETAVAALILPTVVSNVMQALRQGPGVAWVILRRYWLLTSVLTGSILVSAQLLPLISQRALFIILGGPLVAYTLAELTGHPLRLSTTRHGRTEWVVGLVSGFFGGLSGAWGPLIVAYLLALGVPKVEHVRAQGVIYLVAGAALLVGHLKSGVLNMHTLPLSVLLLLPAGVGMWIGFKVHDWLDPTRFRRWTLIVLAVAGANLLRRGLMG